MNVHAGEANPPTAPSPAVQSASSAGTDWESILFCRLLFLLLHPKQHLPQNLTLFFCFVWQQAVCLWPSLFVVFFSCVITIPFDNWPNAEVSPVSTKQWVLVFIPAVPNIKVWCLNEWFLFTTATLQRRSTALQEDFQLTRMHCSSKTLKHTKSMHSPVFLLAGNDAICHRCPSF